MEKNKKKITEAPQMKNNPLYNSVEKKKTATNNQWISTGLQKPHSEVRRDGPGGENAEK